MTEAGYIEQPVEMEEYTETVTVTEDGQEIASGGDEVLNDGAGPLLASLQIQDLKSNSATIIWSTDEGSTSQVKYGIAAADNETVEDTALTTFHRVVLTGLSPYKYYKYQVISKDKFGNTSSSDVAVFTTLR